MQFLFTRLSRVRDIRATCHTLRLTHVQGNRQAPCRRIVPCSGAFKATVTPGSTISGSYDWLRLGHGTTDHVRQCLLRSPAAIVYRDRSVGECCYIAPLPILKHVVFSKITRSMTWCFHLTYSCLKAKMYAISSDTHQLQFLKLHHFKLEGI